MVLVNRKLIRRFEYVQSAVRLSGNVMGTIEITKLSSPELGDWHIYQLVRNHTERVENTGAYEGHVSTTTETVIDFPTYSEALGYMATIEKDYVADPGYRTNLPTHPGTTIGSTTEKNTTDPLWVRGLENKDDL